MTMLPDHTDAINQFNEEFVNATNERETKGAAVNTPIITVEKDARGWITTTKYPDHHSTVAEQVMFSDLTALRARLAEVERISVLLGKEHDLTTKLNELVCASYGALTPDGCDLPPSGIYSMPDKIRALLADLTSLRADLAAAHSAMQEFVDKVDNGKARSVETCIKFKTLLTKSSP